MLHHTTHVLFFFCNNNTVAGRVVCNRVTIRRVIS
nr:MAG TPA: hypothetical protein [Caudoviricetes sp.]